MARGGIAGFYDRNKKWLTPVAEMLAGAVGGPLASAGLGAAIKGFDRPGKRGIGFNAGQAALGGLEGYGMGRVGGGIKSGMSSLLTGGGGALPAPPSVAIPEMSYNATTGAIDTASKAASAAGASPAALLTGGVTPPKPAPNWFSTASDFAKNNRDILSGVGKGTLAVMQGQQAQASDRAKLGLDQSRFDFEKQQYEDEQKRKRQLAELLAPLFAKQAQASYGA